MQQLDTSLSDFDSLIMTQFQLLAAEAGMPVSKLMKTQSKGLGDTVEPPLELVDYGNLPNPDENDEEDLMGRYVVNESRDVLYIWFIGEWHTWTDGATMQLKRET